MSPKRKESIDTLLKRLKKEILPLFEKVISEEDVIFSNPNIARCRDITDCRSKDCTVNKDSSAHTRCWQIAGTYCDGKRQGSFSTKIDSCAECKVFIESCPTIVEELGENFNNMIFFLNKQKKNLLDKQHEIEKLNKELTQALHKISLKDKEISEAKITDKLTGLFTRPHLVTVLEEEMARCHRYNHPLAIMIIDIDRFKSVNRDYGHKAGDKIIAFLGKLIKKNVRKFDRSFRYGEEEFVVVLPETDLMLAYFVAERIRKQFQNKAFKLKKKKDSEDHSVSRTVSIGISATFNYSTNGIKVENLLDQIEQSLAQAKEKGGNKCIRYV